MKTSFSLLVGTIFTLLLSSCCDSIYTARTVVPVVPDGSRKDSAWISLPKKYYCSSHKDTKFPLLIFFHGGGGSSSVGSRNLDQIINDGHNTPPVLIKNRANSNVLMFGSPENQFIVVSPQHSTGFRNGNEIKVIIDSLKAKYRVDQAKIYLTGFSSGGYSIMDFLSKNSTNGSLITAAVVMSSSGFDLPMYHPEYLATNNVKLWVFCGDDDSQLGTNQQFVTRLNNINAGLGKFTTYPGAHCCWSQPFDPSNSYYNPNIYQWLLSQAR